MFGDTEAGYIKPGIQSRLAGDGNRIEALGRRKSVNVILDEGGILQYGIVVPLCKPGISAEASWEAAVDSTMELSALSDVLNWGSAHKFSTVEADPRYPPPLDMLD